MNCERCSEISKMGEGKKEELILNCMMETLVVRECFQVGSYKLRTLIVYHSREMHTIHQFLGSLVESTLVQISLKMQVSYLKGHQIISNNSSQHLIENNKAT
jgi:hypothetical protein